MPAERRGVVRPRSTHAPPSGGYLPMHIARPLPWSFARSILGRPVAFHALVGAVLLLLVAVIYGQVRSFAFVDLDDQTYVYENRHVLTGLTLANVRWSVVGIHDCNWIPLTWLSLMLDATFYGPWPGGYHITNVLLHALCSLLLYALLVKATGRATRSAFVAAIFAVHPLHVESVAWISERKDVLSTFFGLLSILFYVDYAKLRRRRFLCASIALFVLSLLSKPSLVSLPLVLLLLDYWPLSRFPAWRVAESRSPVQHAASQGAAARNGGECADKSCLPWSSWLVEKVPFVFLSAVFCVITLVAQGPAIRLRADVPALSRFLNAFVSYCTYVWMAVMPHDLVVYYPHPGGQISISRSVLAIGFIAATSCVAVLKAHRWPFLFVGWFWYLVTLLPMIGLVQVGGQQMADRYTYFPLVGLLIIVAWLIPELSGTEVAVRRIVAVLAAANVVVFAAGASLQTAHWRDGATLFAHALECTSDNALTRGCLGSALLQQGRMTEALGHFEAAVRIAPQSADAHVGLGIALQRFNRLDDAAAHYRRAIALDDSNVSAHLNLGAIFIDKIQYSDARRELDRALALDPDHAMTYSCLAKLAQETGQWLDAVTYAKAALSRDPRMDECQLLLAKALQASGRTLESIDLLRELNKRAPGDTAFQLEYARALALNGEVEAAQHEYQTLLRDHPNSQPARDELAALERWCEGRNLARKRRRPADAAPSTTIRHPRTSASDASS